jgi:hypothetical protein
MNLNRVLPPTVIYAISGDNDYVIHEIQGEIVTFESADSFEENKEFIIYLLDFDYKNYLSYSFKVNKIIRKIKKQYSYLYTIMITGNVQAFTEHLKKIEKVVFDENSDNLQGKGNIKESQFNKKKLSDYNYEKDNEFCDSYLEQVAKWFNIPTDNYEGYKNVIEKVEMAFCINNYVLYQNVIDKGCTKTINDYLVNKNIKGNGVFSKPFTRVYIGNEFCHNLLMDDSMLINILNICMNEGYKITIAFPYLLECRIGNIKVTVKKLNQWCLENNKKIEVLINDWGMIQLINEYNSFIPVLGRLMNKRKKDPRISWIWGSKKNKELLKINNLNCDHFIKFMEKYGIKRCEYEDHIIGNKITNLQGSLHFPYFQINTSVFCPTYAQCNKYDRHKQNLITQCPRYCEEFVFLYPEHLNMIGKGNCIFGYNNMIFIDPIHIMNYINQGIDRLVYSAI